MTREELIEKIENGRDIMFDVSGKHYTILTWWEDGILIAEQFTEAHAETFATAEALVDCYLVDGVSLGKLAEKVEITDYS